MKHFLHRLPLLVPGVVALLAGLAAGVERLGWQFGQQVSWGVLHGLLMVPGFFGTLISLERAVALDRGEGYVVPAAFGGGALLTLMGSTWTGPLLLILASLGLVGMLNVAWRLQRHLSLQIMAAGALALLVGTVAWAAGQPASLVAPWWMAFLVLTIAGERLELSRILLYDAQVARRFLGIVGLLGLGLGLTFFQGTLAWRLTGAALLLLMLWLLRYDIARYTVRQRELTRFIAWCLLSGYGWLGVGGFIMLVYGQLMAGPWYDAALHSIFVGFVFSMVFGHAPIIFPAVLGVPVAYRPCFYGHLVLLHGGLLMRVIGDVTEMAGWRRWGGLVNALAILVFLMVTLGTTWAAHRRTRTQTHRDQYA